VLLAVVGVWLGAGSVGRGQEPKAVLPFKREHGAIFAESPDGRMAAAACWDGGVELWDVLTGGRRAVLEGHTGRVDSLVFSRDSTLLASGSCDGTVKVWNLFKSEQQATLKGHDCSVTHLMFSGDGRRLVSVGADFGIRLWDVRAVLKAKH
jgi:WD40 repeat protein